MIEKWKQVPFHTLFRRIPKRTGHGDKELLSVYRDYGVIIKSGRNDNSNRPGESLDDYQLVNPGDLVLNKMKTWQGSLGISAYEGIVSPAYFVYEPQGDFDARYMHHLLRSQPSIDYYGAHSKGIRVNQWDLQPEYLDKMKVWFPPFETQQRIADYLDRETAEIDAAVADLDNYVELLNVKLESTAREIFTTLSQERQLIQTKFLVDITTGSGDTQDAQEDGEYPFYVRSDTIQRSGDYEFDCDAVLTSGDGAGVGKIFHLASGKFKAHQRVYVMHNFRRISPEYFYWMFKSAFPDVIRYGGAKSTVDSVRMPMIANLKLPVPDNSTQEEISGRLANLHEEVGSLIAESTKLRDLLLKRRSVLITEVVTGRKQV